MSILLILTGAIISCGEPQQAEEEPADLTEIEVTQMDSPDENGFLYTLPSPLQIASIFRRSGLTFVPNLANSPKNVSNYNTKFIQKLNFGAYAADLAYSALNEQNQACIDYVQALSSLSESLWMTNVFSSVSILKRFESNMGNSDSLGYIISDFQMELDNYLEENGLSTNSLIIFTGAWIESMHLALQSVKDHPNPVLMSRLIEQKKILLDLIEILGKEEKDAELDILMAGLVKISENFSAHDIESMSTEEDLAKLSMSPEEIASLAADVADTRKFIING
ncbi:MAG TPA: hypothetical protein DCX54_01800 [Flavobacteriales bacterium]|nr:hypothetical protein [Flavobacteriales bacterium]